MGIPIRELQERVSSAEFAEYWAAYRLDPWGEDRGDWRAAQQALLTVAVAGSKDAKFEDFLPVFDESQRRHKPKQSMEEQIAIMAMMTVGSGGDDLRPLAQQGAS